MTVDGRAWAGPTEEVRIDPADGRARTFAELREACAQRYGEAEIASYWETECSPYAPSAFEGSWSAGARINVISGPWLYWQSGVVSPAAEVDGELEIELEGARHRARLQGGRLLWSDGEVWTRPDGGPDFAVGQQVRYWSHSAAKWVLAVVRGRHRDGTYELDVKRRADPALLRPHRSEASEARWRMQLPRALAELEAGDPKAFERLVAARAAATVGHEADRVIAETLQDAVALCSSLGFSSEELERELAAIKERKRRSIADAAAAAASAALEAGEAAG